MSKRQDPLAQFHFGKDLCLITRHEFMALLCGFTSVILNFVLAACAWRWLEASWEPKWPGYAMAIVTVALMVAGCIPVWRVLKRIERRMDDSAATTTNAKPAAE